MIEYKIKSRSSDTFFDKISKHARFGLIIIYDDRSQYFFATKISLFDDTRYEPEEKNLTKLISLYNHYLGMNEHTK